MQKRHRYGFSQKTENHICAFYLFLLTFLFFCFMLAFTFALCYIKANR